jgi:predicted MFS family arabinose efflux permease
MRPDSEHAPAPERAPEPARASPGKAPAGSARSPWAPLRIRVFRGLWLASLASNVGSWMHLVAASWLMTSLTASAALVALLQTANSAPGFALALPAGALADVLDRRRVVLATQVWQLLLAGALGALTLSHVTTPALLLAMTAALAVGSALGVPAFGSLTPELVPRAELASAISLNSMVLTASQAIGPAIGGLLVASLGAGAVFVLNAVSFLAVVGVVAAWRRPRLAPGLPPEHVSSAIRTGLRYVANAPAFRVVLIRAGAYVLSFSALPALLAVFTRSQLHGTASDYGLLLGALGVGGVSGALILPRARARWSTDWIVTTGTLLYAAALVTVATLPSIPLACGLLLVAGLAGMANMSSLNIAGQSVLADWVRGRGLAVIQLTFMLALAAGGALWGFAATRIGVSSALQIAAACLAATTLLGWRFRLGAAEAVDSSIAEQPEPHVPASLSPDDGPVLLSVEYRIDPGALPGFLIAAGRLARMRRREGAMRWGLYADPDDAQRQVETFMAPSWSEHLRSSTRLTGTDAQIIARARSFHTGPEEPKLTAMLGYKNTGSHHDHRDRLPPRHQKAPAAPPVHSSPMSSTGTPSPSQHSEPTEGAIQ